MPTVPTVEGIRESKPSIVSFTAADLRKPWDQVRDRLHAAIPEASYMNGPAAESAEATQMGAKGPEGSASQALYGQFWSEADRSWGGLQVLHAVYQGTDEAYQWVTQKQKVQTLTKERFLEMHRELLDAAPDDRKLQGLVWAVLCNDLGKTEKLNSLYRNLMGREPPDHDRLLGELLEAHPECFPAYGSMDKDERQALMKTFKCGCDVAQFLQLEVAPEEVKGLGQLSAEERKLYILHSKYDIAGAASHFIGAGSVVFTESTAQAFEAAQKALNAFDKGVGHQEVYDLYIDERARLLGLQPPLTGDARLAVIVACMSRITIPEGLKSINMVLQDPKNAEAVKVLRENLGTVHAYYGPAVVLNPEVTLRKQALPDSTVGTRSEPEIDERFDPSFASKVDPGFDRPKVEGLWVGLTSLAKAFVSFNALDSRAGGTIPDTSVRQLDLGELARALQRPAVLQPGQPLPAICLQGADMGAVAAIIDPKSVQTMSQLANEIVTQLGLPKDAEAGLARALRGLPESTQDLLSDAFQLISAKLWSGGKELHQAMSAAGKAIGLSADELAKRYLILLGQCAFALVRLPVEQRTWPHLPRFDLSALAAKPDTCLRGGDLTLQRRAKSDSYAPDLTPHLDINLQRFQQMTDLSQVPGKKVLCIGTGGMDGAQAAQVAMQLRGAGKTVTGVVSVRGLFTGSPSDPKSLGAPRTVEHHGGEIAPGVFVMGATTAGTGRMYENVMAKDVPMHLLIDNDLDVGRQLDALINNLGGADTVLVVSTSGRVFDGDGQESRIQRAVANLSNVKALTVVLPLLTSEGFENQAVGADAQFHAFTDTEAQNINATYRKWGMDGSNDKLWGNGPFTLQAALHTRNYEGPAAFPYPTWVVKHPEQPRDPFKPLNLAMAGCFIMDSKAVVAASSEAQQPAVGELLAMVSKSHTTSPQQLKRIYQSLGPNQRRALQRQTNVSRVDVQGISELIAAMPDAASALRTLANLYEAARNASDSVTAETAVTVDISALLASEHDPHATIAVRGTGSKLTAVWEIDD